MSVEHTDPTCVTAVKVTAVPWSGRTASGYGAAIPTRYMVRYGWRWHRVRAMVYGNSGSLYIRSSGTDLFLDIDTEYRLAEVGASS